jgi:hypothetical protein
MECFTRIFDAYFLSSALHGDNEIRLGSRGRLTYMNCFELVKNYEFSCPFKLRDMNHADKLTRGPRKKHSPMIVKCSTEEVLESFRFTKVSDWASSEDL